MWAFSMLAIDPSLHLQSSSAICKADSSTSSSVHRAELLSRITVRQSRAVVISRLPDLGNCAMALKRTGLEAKLSERPAAAECPLMAQSRHAQCADECPPLGANRTFDQPLLTNLDF
jgi:hypothetical protein